MLRLCYRLLLIVPLAIAPWRTAHAQTQPAAPANTPFGTLSPEQARAALDTLNDPKKRADLTATLDALVKAQSQPAPPASAPAPGSAPAAAPGVAAAPESVAAPAAAPPAKPAEAIPIQLAPNSLGAQVLLAASAFLNETVSDLSDGLHTVRSFPLLWAWVVVMVTSPLGQHLLANTSWRLVVSVLVALAADQALRVLLRRPMARVLAAGQRPSPPAEPEDDAQDRAERGAIEPPRKPGDREGTGRRIGLGLTRFMLRIVPILGLLTAGHMMAASRIGGEPDSRLIILAVLDATAACLALLALLTLLFSPEPPGLRLLNLRPSIGAYLVRWGRRLVLIAVPGYAIGEVALLLGLSPLAHDVLQKTVGLVLVVCLAIIVVQRRRSVRRWLSAEPDATGVVAWLRNMLARTWHWIALFFLTAFWLAWALHAPDAITRTLWYFMATASVVIVASLARATVLALIGPARADAEAYGGAPIDAVRLRLSVYHPALRRLTNLVIDLLALLALMQLYGIGGLSWLLTSNVGQRVLSGVVTMAVTIALAFVVWESVNIAIHVHLETLRREAQAARSARMRTLLPLIRATMAITVLVIAGLMVLSEIGVNIAPLLAGAGIVGVAIGFGSQKLVQDVITGVFLLLENTMQVGDVVKVGDQTGIVESLSVRTIRLRTEDGSVVVIPFSAVTTVINMTRDYSRSVFTVNIAVEEDVDRAIDTLRAIVKEMREEPAWSSIILDDLEVFGLDHIADTALQLKCRVMCTPFGRWSVGREFNRRLTGRFQIVAVAAPNSALRLLAASGAEAPVVAPPAQAEAQPAAAAGQ